MQKLPISAIVVGRNESSQLERCLDSISFCDEIIYIDLQSEDNSYTIAQSKGAIVKTNAPVPIVEIIHANYYLHTKHDIILISDPDEKTDPELRECVPFLIQQLGANTKYGAVYVPMINYFKKHKLKGTIWGGPSQGRTYLVNKRKYEFLPYVHAGRKLKEGYYLFYFDRSGNNIIHHFWAKSWSQLFEKHKRYIKKEGEARFKNGKRTSISKIISTPFTAFFECWYRAKGYKDGIAGLLLSAFWSWYQTSSEINLWFYQKTIYSSKRELK